MNCKTLVPLALSAFATVNVEAFSSFFHKSNRDLATDFDSREERNTWFVTEVKKNADRRDLLTAQLGKLLNEENAMIDLVKEKEHAVNAVTLTRYKTNLLNEFHPLHGGLQAKVDKLFGDRQNVKLQTDDLEFYKKLKVEDPQRLQRHGANIPELEKKLEALKAKVQTEDADLKSDKERIQVLDHQIEVIRRLLGYCEKEKEKIAEKYEMPSVK